jgi:hypothetical protein
VQKAVQKAAGASASAAFFSRRPSPLLPHSPLMNQSLGMNSLAIPGILAKEMWHF